MCYCLQALEKAKEAGRKERVLVRQREQMSMGDQINLDLTYSVSKLMTFSFANINIQEHYQSVKQFADVPGRLAQSVTCLTTDGCLTADSGSRV